MKALSTAASSARHLMGASIEAFLLVAIVAALAFGVALATGHPAGASGVFAKGANGGGGGGGNSTAAGSITLITPVAAAAPTNWPTLGDEVDFATSASVKDPRVEVLCYQAADPSGLAMYVDGKGYLVYGEARGATADQGDYMGTNPFVLGGGMSAWLLDGGSASCTANLFYFGMHAGSQTYNWLASTDFTTN